MNKIITSIATICLFLSLSFNAQAEGNGGGKHYVLNLIGTGLMYPGVVADIDGDGIDDPAMCFDVDLINAKNQRLIGTATDCLSKMSPAGLGLVLVGTTFFHLPEGDLVVRGNTSVQQAHPDTETPAGQKMTHVTGAAGPGNAVIDGTGRFAGAAGTARLSGMVNLATFNAAEGDPISFDCLFVIDLY